MTIHRAFVATWLAAFALVACVLPDTAAADAGELHARHLQLREQLRNSPFGGALHIDSAEQPDRLQGDVYAVLDHSFATVSQALKDPARWCDILILPFNTKYCHAVQAANGPALQVRIGRKYNQPVEQAFRIEFAHRNVAAQPDYLESRLSAQSGPMGTRDYRIVVSAVPLDGGKRSFLQLSYSYGFGSLGRMAMQAYLNTAGADKVGFTIVGRDGNGQPQFINGVRGAIERNAMRYYLAIDAYLDSLSAPPDQQVQARIRGWFDATERFPLQLREMPWPTYASMKLQEHERQQALLN
ncbi:hypothetical protein EZ313_12000 [Ramlibacter henchirensis]|uniref:Uncharacterized protein n=1 Tax=Ramlibacter henchirensis TaxID=204072 RepID=A0A4Z0C6J2_9BURK|nr:hypothetical protein [Ramlibacter henchirensis]TFZ07286.1 hypothetical protein EZ313_12000 [Ramlibacter henchirensis]